jgi:uncharacterized protein YihD (DUF1040 family)
MRGGLTRPYQLRTDDIDARHVVPGMRDFEPDYKRDCFIYRHLKVHEIL